jgi:hypothetical protein
MQTIQNTANDSATAARLFNAGFLTLDEVFAIAAGDTIEDTVLRAFARLGMIPAVEVEREITDKLIGLATATVEAWARSVTRIGKSFRTSYGTAVDLAIEYIDGALYADEIRFENVSQNNLIARTA